MGRKSSSKGKEKRLQRKEEQMKIAQAKEVVGSANKLKDPMEPFPVFRKYNKNGIDAELYVKRVSELEESTKDWVFELTKSNMKETYEGCSWGWNNETKKEELMEDSAWYLIAESFEGIPMGFSHFRFDLDEGIEVLYCYELQIEPLFVRKGLGKFMMQILELIAFTNQMRKVVLTILKHNKSSEFFRSLNYEMDESSPVDYDDNTYAYAILSKVNKRLAVNNSTSHGSDPHTHHHNCCPGH